MLGHTLKLIRLYNSLNVNTVALQMQIWPRILKKIEACKKKVSLSTLENFSNLYQIPIYEILLLNDKKEHLQVSDAEMWEDIERFYVTKQDEQEEKIKTK